MPRKGYILTDEHRRKISESNKGRNLGRKLTEEHRKKLSEAKIGTRHPNWGKTSGMLGRHHTKETKKKISESSKGKNKGFKHTEETKKLWSIKRKGKKQSKELIEKRISPLRRRKRPSFSREVLQKMSKGQFKRFQNPKEKEKQSERVRQKWQDPKFVKKQMIARDARPNKPELFILNILNELYPNEWKYTGDFSFMIGGKNPDFTNIDGQKKLIEHFGAYYHKGEDSQERINHFKRWGFDTLIIWEYELRNIKEIEDKIRNFVEKGD